MSMERFKLDLARGIAALLPYAREHRMTEALYLEELKAHRGPRPERCHMFPPYKLALTIQPIEGRDLPMVSVSAQWRPVKVLSDEEKRAVDEAMADCFPGHGPMKLVTLKPTAGYKLLMVPEDAPPGLRKALEEYKAI